MRQDAGVFLKEQRAVAGPQFEPVMDTAFGLARQIVSRLRGACETLEMLNSHVGSGPPRDQDKATEPATLIGLLQEAMSLTDSVNRESNALAGKIGQ